MISNASSGGTYRGVPRTNTNPTASAPASAAANAASRSRMPQTLMRVRGTGGTSHTAFAGQVGRKAIEREECEECEGIINDKAETTAVKRALGEQAYNIPISSTKSVTGHLMGSAGSVEAVLTIMAMQNNFVPPTINLDDPDPECDLNYTPHKGIHHNIDVAMSNSFGFGGHNAVLIFGKYSENGRN